MKHQPLTLAEGRALAAYIDARDGTRPPSASGENAGARAGAANQNRVDAPAGGSTQERRS